MKKNENNSAREWKLLKKSTQKAEKSFFLKKVPQSSTWQQYIKRNENSRLKNESTNANPRLFVCQFLGSQIHILSMFHLKYSLNITVSQNRIKNNISPLRYNIYFRRFTCFQEEKIKSSASIRLYRTIYSHPENNLQKTTYKKCPPDRKSCIATTQQLFKSNITIRFFSSKLI